MPTILDATVVNSAYDTSGNGGRKLVRLDNGWLVAVTKTTDYFYFFVDKQQGAGFVPLCNIYELNINNNDIALESNGTMVYVIHGRNVETLFYNFFDATTVQNVNIYNGSISLDTQTNMGNMSITINATKTELHATWASRNAIYTNSFNIRYAKGTIATDGSVAWGAVEQWTNYNTVGYDMKNPSMAFVNGKPFVTFDFAGGGNNLIVGMSTSGMANVGSGNLLKPYTFIFQLNGYAQSSPSAIFVPQSVNGLANGRIWVAWHGLDATESSRTNIRVSYSDDGGVTWSAMLKLTSGVTYNQAFATLTADKNNKVYVLWSGEVGANMEVRMISNVSNVWGSISNITAVGNTALRNPSSIYDTTFNFSSPLFIYTGASKVGFYGTWTVTTISVTQGSIGQKTDKSNVLTYSITTDGTMSTITEKVNGVTIGTKTATSGQSLIAGLTQAQWDAVKFGKYKDITAGLNTLTIEMGTEIFTYTFDKRPASDADMLSVAKAVQDSANVSLPAKKSLLGTAIRAKGGTVLDADSFEVMASVLSASPVKKYATGTVSSVAGTVNIPNYQGSTVNMYYVPINMNVIGFIPSRIVIRLTGGGQYLSTWTKENFLNDSASINANNASIINTVAHSSRIPFIQGIMNFPALDSIVKGYTWEAFE